MDHADLGHKFSVRAIQPNSEKKQQQKHQSFPEKMLPLIVNQIRPERETDRQTDIENSVVFNFVTVSTFVFAFYWPIRADLTQRKN